MSQEEIRSRFALIIRLPRDVEVRIEDTYLSVIGVTRPAMGFHLTLVGPYRLAPGVTSPHLTAVARACRLSRPFAVRLEGLGVFRTENDNAVYLGVPEPELVVALHAQLLRAAGSAVVPENEQMRVWTFENYSPHVTLGLHMSDADLEEFLRLGARRRIHAQFTVERVWLVEQVPNGPWEYTAGYALGPEPSVAGSGANGH